MAKKKISEEPEIVVEVKAPKLTEEQKAAIVEEYLGVHPKYFIYAGHQIAVNTGQLNLEGKQFNGFLPHLRELGIIK